MKYRIKILDPMNLLCANKVFTVEDPHDLMEEIESRLAELGPKWTLEIEVIEA